MLVCLFVQTVVLGGWKSLKNLNNARIQIQLRICTKIESILPRHTPNMSTKFRRNPSRSFSVILFTNKQTNENPQLEAEGADAELFAVRFFVGPVETYQKMSAANLYLSVGRRYGAKCVLTNVMNFDPYRSQKI